MKFLCYYPETSGLVISTNPLEKSSSIIQLNAILFQCDWIDGNLSIDIIDQFSSNVQPDFDNDIIDDLALKYLGLQIQQLQTYPNKLNVVDNFLNKFEPHIINEKVTIIGYNNYKLFDYMLFKLFNTVSSNKRFNKLFFKDTIDLKSLSSLFLFPIKLSLKDEKFDTINKVFGFNINNKKYIPYSKVYGCINMFKTLLQNNKFLIDQDIYQQKFKNKKNVYKGE